MQGKYKQTPQKSLLNTNIVCLINTDQRHKPDKYSPAKQRRMEKRKNKESSREQSRRHSTLFKAVFVFHIILPTSFIFLIFYHTLYQRKNYYIEKDIAMKKLFKLLSISLMLVFFPLYIVAQQMSVHDMFKDYTESELIEMMEKGQQFIDDLQKNGTPEEKEAFEKAMEDTLKNFSQDDWQEFQEIVDVVKDKLPPTPEQQWKPEPIKRDAKKDEKPSSTKTKDKEVVNSTVKKIINNINKKVKSIFQKAQSDKMLHEQITTHWDKRDDFNEMIRQVMVLNKDKHITKIEKASDDEDKALLESLKNFNIRLNQEDKIFQIADTFGLDIDEKTAKINRAKLNRVLEFFNSGVSSLAPKVKGFIKKYEPEALKKAEELSKLEKEALDFSKNNQKVPGGVIAPSGRRSTGGHVPSMAHHGGGRYTGGRYPHHNRGLYPRGYNPRQGSNMQRDKDNTSQAGKFEKQLPEQESKAKEQRAATPLEEAKDALQGYLDAFDSEDIKRYTNFTQAAMDNYSSVNFIATMDHNARMSQLRAGHASLKDDAEKINNEIIDMQNVIQKTQAKLSSMNDDEFANFKKLDALKKIQERHALYSQLSSNAQTHLLSKFTTNIATFYTALATQAQRDDYKKVHDEIAKIHGIKEQIDATKSLIDNLNRYIKKEERKRARSKKSKSSSSARRYA